MADRNMRLKLGGFVAAALSGLTGLILLFGGSPNLFTSQASYVVLFPEAPGVSVGTPVRKSGVRIGQVTKIDLDEETGLVRVHLLMDPKYLPRTSELPTISRGLLSGDTTLDLLPKVNPDGTPLPQGETYPIGTTIEGVPPINPRALLTQATGTLPTAQETIQQILVTFRRFENTAPKLDSALDEVAALARSARETIPEFRQTNARVQDLIGFADPDERDPMDGPPTLRVALKEVIELLQAIRPAAEEVRDLIKENGPEFTKTIQSVRQTTESVNDVLNPENRKAFAGILKNLDEASDDLTKAIRLAAILLDRGESTLKEINGRLSQAEEVLNNVNRASKPIGDNAEKIVQEATEAVSAVNSAANQLNRVLTDVRVLVEKSAGQDGTVQKLLSDPGLYNNLNDSVISATRLLMRAERIAQDLQVFADKVARRPEIIGVGGAVRPSAGLKGDPLAPLPQDPLMPLPPSPRGPAQPGAGPYSATSGLTPIAPVTNYGGNNEQSRSYKTLTGTHYDLPLEPPPQRR